MIANGVARRQKPCPLYPSSRPVMGTGSVYTCIAAFGVVRCDSSHFLPSTGRKRHGVSGGATNDPRGLEEGASHARETRRAATPTLSGTGRTRLVPRTGHSAERGEGTALRGRQLPARRVGLTRWTSRPVIGLLLLASLDAHTCTRAHHVLADGNALRCRRRRRHRGLGASRAPTRVGPARHAAIATFAGQVEPV